MTDAEIDQAIQWIRNTMGEEDFNHAYSGFHDGITMTFQYEDKPLVVFFDGDAGVALATLSPDDIMGLSWAIYMSSRYVTLYPENLYEMSELMSMEAETLEEEKAAKRLTSITA